MKSTATAALILCGPSLGPWRRAGLTPRPSRFTSAAAGSSISSPWPRACRPHMTPTVRPPTSDRYHAEGLVRLDHFTGPTTADFSSEVPVVFTAANGDELHFDYAGTVELVPLGGDLFVTVWVAPFTPAAGSTGRFADVIGGSFIMTAVTDPFAVLGDTDIAYTWEGSGTLVFRRGK